MINLPEILEKASKLRIAVIGDLIQDEYIVGDVERISPEAPVQVVNQTEHKVSMGGAGNVFMNLLNLGVKSDLYCYFKGEKEFWDSQQIGFWYHDYPHAIKTRIMCGYHHLLRVDKEARPNEIEWLQFNGISWSQDLLSRFEMYDAIVLSDYNKGVLSDSVINTVFDYALKCGIPVIVDAKKDFHRFKNAHILKCNYKEWCGPKPDGVKNIVNMVDKLSLGHFIVTRGDKGVLYCSGVDHGDSIDQVNGIPVHNVDVCGAGDTVTAVLAMMVKEPIRHGVILANIAAAEVCKHSGVHPITKEELSEAFKIYTQS